MRSEERKDTLISLYKAISNMIKIIERDLDKLSDEGNTTEFVRALSELLELAGKLLKK